MTTLNRVARIAVQDLEWRPMLDRIVTTLADEFGWAFVACATIDHERGEFVCDAVCGSLPTDVTVGYRRALGTGVVGQCAVSGCTIDIDDARAHPDVIDTLHGTGSELCVPVLHNGVVLAVLNAESEKVGAFRGQRALLETVADQIAGILHAANLYEQLQHANRQLRAAFADVERLSRNDSLTGVANRRQYALWMDQALRESITSQRPLALLIIDIDHFKRYNDCHGHVAGDICLRAVAATLESLVCGTTARLARYGGEEFVVIAPDADRTAAAELAERLRAAVERNNTSQVSAGPQMVTVSIGVASQVLSTDSSAGALLDMADAALYSAKEQGRNRVVVAPA